MRRKPEEKETDTGEVLGHMDRGRGELMSVY